MPGFIRKLSRLLVKVLEITVILVTGFLVLDVLWGVFTRYVLHAQSPWTEELARMLLIWVSLLGASLAFIRGSHLGVDYFVGKFGIRMQTLFQILVYLLIALFASIAMIYGGIRLVTSTLENGQPLQALHFEKGYVYLAVPISGFFIVVFSIETIIKNAASFFVKPKNN
ncbi:MAG: TRAP transporter small permease [Sedimentisphaerales bacterium]|jgi:TRAP-type C4-dicarboxylate transport system permease small subunit